MSYEQFQGRSLLFKQMEAPQAMAYKPMIMTMAAIVYSCSYSRYSHELLV